MNYDFTGDELVLALISLIRVVDTRMLQQGPDGFTVDFTPLDRKQGQFSADEVLLMKLRVILESNSESRTLTLDLDDAERRRLAETLAGLESLQAWSADVLGLSQGMRKRLLAEGGQS